MDQDQPSSLPGDEVTPPVPQTSGPDWPAPSYYASATVMPLPPKRRVRARVVATVGVVAIVIAVVAAIGLGGENGTPVSNAHLLSLIHSASAAITTQPANSFVMNETVTDGGEHATLTMRGVTDSLTHDAQFSMTGLGIDETAVTVNKVSYFRMPASALDLTNGKPWLAVHELTPSPEIKQLQQAGPAAYLQMLSTANGTVYNEGKHTVNGVQTTEYSFHINALKLLGSTFTQIAGADSTDALKTLGFDHLPMKLWLDDQGLPRELELSFSTHGVSVDAVGYITPSAHEPHISAPPASQVDTVGSLTDFTSILRQAISGEVDPSQISS